MTETEQDYQDERSLHAELMELLAEDIAPEPPRGGNPLWARWVDICLFGCVFFVIGFVVGAFAVAL